MLQAELAMQAGEWSTARERLEAALGAHPTARVYRLLAEVERQSGGNPAKVQEWLARATDAEPDRAWVCDDTGELVPSWQPLGPTGRFDAVHWATPPGSRPWSVAEYERHLPREEAAAPMPGAAA